MGSQTGSARYLPRPKLKRKTGCFGYSRSYLSGYFFDTDVFGTGERYDEFRESRFESFGPVHLNEDFPLRQGPVSQHAFLLALNSCPSVRLPWPSVDVHTVLWLTRSSILVCVGVLPDFFPQVQTQCFKLLPVIRRWQLRIVKSRHRNSVWVEEI